MQKNEIDKSARVNISNERGCVFIIAGTIKKEVCPTKEEDPKA